jgi:hypothetical protein
MSDNQWHPAGPHRAGLEPSHPSNPQDAINELIAQIDLAIASCRMELQAHQDKLRRLERARASLAGVPLQSEAWVPVEWSATDGATTPGRATRRRERKGSIAFQVREGARAILREAGRPLNRAQLLELLEAKGIRVEAKQPAKQIGKIMWQSEEFQHLAEGYWFRDEPPPSR